MSLKERAREPRHVIGRHLDNGLTTCNSCRNRERLHVCRQWLTRVAIPTSALKETINLAAHGMKTICNDSILPLLQCLDSSFGINICLIQCDTMQSNSMS